MSGHENAKRRARDGISRGTITIPTVLEQGFLNHRLRRSFDGSRCGSQVKKKNIFFVPVKAQAIINKI